MLVCLSACSFVLTVQFLHVFSVLMLVVYQFFTERLWGINCTYGGNMKFEDLLVVWFGWLVFGSTFIL